MKRWLWLAAGALAVAALSGQRSAGTDVGHLQPIQVVRVTRAEKIVIDTDTGELGMGQTLPDAFENLGNTAPGQVFLDTAEYLILAPDCVALLPELNRYLRPSCRVCLEEGGADIAKAGAYLEAHPPSVTLAQWRAGEDNLPALITLEGRMELVS